MSHSTLRTFHDQLMQMCGAVCPRSSHQTEQLTIPLQPCHQRTSCPWCSPSGLVQPFQGAAVGCRQLPCSPVCLLLHSARRVATDPGGHCFYFAKLISYPVWGRDSEEEVRGEPHPLPSILELSSFLHQLGRDQVSEEAKDLRISSYLAVPANIDDTELSDNGYSIALQKLVVHSSSVSKTSSHH